MGDNMEITNNTIYTEKALKKYANFSINKGKQHWVSRVFSNAFWWLLMGSLIICMLILIVSEPSNLIYLLLHLIIAAMEYLLFFVFIPKIIYKNKKESKEIIGLNVQFSFNDNNFIVNSFSELVNTNDTCKYELLYKTYEVDEYFYLFIDKMVVFIVDKNGFENTTPYEFSKFLESKLPPKKFIRCK